MCSSLCLYTSLCFGFNEGDRALLGLLIEAFSSVWSNYFWPTGHFTKRDNLRATSDKMKHEMTVSQDLKVKKGI